MRSGIGLATVLLAAAVVAGCSEIPTSGPVIGGESVEPPSEEQRFIQVEAPPPAPGANPLGIVNGFIEAMASYEPGYETAREFLTDEAAAAWNPAEGVTVYMGATPTFETIAEDRVDVQMSVAATVGADGTYRAAEPGTVRRLNLQLVQEGGEWRIANPEPGIVIAVFSFEREYEARNVYFFDPSFEVLVPDPVYIPRTASAATLLARKVLSGPTDWLAPAVRTAFPDGTELEVNAVPVEGGVATVELGPAAAVADPEMRELMAAQLTWTLGMLPDVERVAVTSGRAPLFQGEALSPRDPSMSQYDPAVLGPDTPAYAVGEAGVVSLGGEEPTPVPGPLGSMTNVREVAVNIGGNRGAVITGDGHLLQVATFGDGEVLQTVLEGVDLTSPAWDRTGLLWAVDHGVEGPGLVAARADGNPVQIAVPALAGRDVERLAVSPDGVRIAMIVDGRAYVGDIIRDADSRGAVKIEGLLAIGPAGEAVDVAWTTSSGAWSTSDSVIVLSGTEQGVLPRTVGLSGQVTTPRGVPVDDAVRVTAAPGLPAVLETADGVLFVQRAGNSWSEIGAGRAPAYPG
ncbi:LpqB family beta-propeller domain-containing protein [Jiangella gansuensis]|uniref:LpqB family beta-propeller domain-containing protein n=1 Tax=Jiangella gansuensis TaxID=281473 RepID=UPI0004791476|nr:LpqB family beta-propeller domain-containing protein [Jiangella gansuensis]